MLCPDVAEALRLLNLATPGDDLWWNWMPDPTVNQPDTIIVLYEDTGRPPDLTHDDPLDAIEHPMLKVEVRAKVHTDGRERIQRVQEAIVGLRNTTLNRTVYPGFVPQQVPFFVERDYAERSVFACTFLVFKLRDPLTTL